MEKLFQIAAALVLMFFYLKVDQISCASAEGQGYEDTYCGSKLVNTLLLVCQGNFNKPGNGGKRSDGLESEPIYWSEYESSTFPFRSPHFAKALLPGTFRRPTRGVVEECCKKSCTLHEMRTYCSIRP